MTAPRAVVPGRFLVVNRRCTQRQFLLRPDAETNNAWVYLLGEAAQRFEGAEGVGGNGDDGEMPNADAIQVDLDRQDHVTLHPAAQAIVDSVEAKGGNARPGAKALSTSDQETINAVVPEDLSPEEIQAISAQLNASGTAPQDTVEAVIAAVQRIRPFGEKRGSAGKQEAAGAHAEAKAVTPASKHSAKHKTKRAGAISPIVELEPALARVITVNPDTGKATSPAALNVRGAVFKIVSVQTAFYGTDGFLLNVQVRVDSVPAGDISFSLTARPSCETPSRPLCSAPALI